MDKLSEWINQTIEQGSDRPIEIQSLDKNSKKKQVSTTHAQKSGDSPKPKFQKSKVTNSQTQNNSNKRTNNNRNNQKEMNKSSSAHNNAQPRKQNPRTNRPQNNRPKPQNVKSHNVKPQNNRQKTPNAKLQNTQPAKAPQKKSGLKPFQGLRIVPMGGLDEVGKNMTAYEYNPTGRPHDKEIIVVDMGFQFPEDDMLGVDYVIPDSTYLEENKKFVKAVIITHGHLDHTGGLPYILPKLNFPTVYATRLTKELINKRLDEFKLAKQADVQLIDPTKPLKLGQFFIEFFRVAHSIPDAVGVVVGTREGKVVYTGDFKFDSNPAGLQPKEDIEKMKRIGNQNVLALLSDSTNSLKEGHTMSESEIGPNIEKYIAEAKGRVIIASFSSLIGRIQQIFEYAQKHNRKIYISGRSIKDNIDIGLKLGLIKVPKSLIHDIKKVKDAKDDEVLMMTTGAQGETMSALTRMAIQDHQHVKIKQNDTVIISSSPIVGNERAIFTVINNLNILGANVIHSQISKIHTSGHAYQEELIQMLGYMKPKYLIPVHGEYFMRQAHKELAIRNGFPAERILLARNGGILECRNGQIKLSNEQVEAKYILIDGLGQGDMGSRVMSERQALSLNGVLMVMITIDKKTQQLKEDPNILSRGFMYMHEYDEVTKGLADLVGSNYRSFISKNNKRLDRKELKHYVRGVAQRYIHQKLERRPLIVPIIFEK